MARKQEKEKGLAVRQKRLLEEREEKPKHRGIDTREVFGQLFKGDFDPKKVEVLDLKFGHRVRGGEQQLVSIIDLGGGTKADCFPVVSRFKPTPGRKIRCYVFFRENEVKFRGKMETRIMAFAIPVNIREAERKGEWLGIGNNILRLQFSCNKADGSFYTHGGPNGKTVIVPKGAGFEPSTTEKASYMVSELMSCFLAHCIVPEGELTQPSEAREEGLVRQAETVGAILEAVDTFGFKVSGRTYDACEILRLAATATTAEIRARHKELAKTEHPDAKANEFRDITGSEPTAEDKQTHNFEFTLIQKAKERMLQVRLREAMRRQYLAKGRKADPEMPKQLAVKILAKRIGKARDLIKWALVKIGYPGMVDTQTVVQEIAWTLVGYVASGALERVDNLSDEAENISVDLTALLLAHATGAQVNGNKTAAERLKELVDKAEAGAMINGRPGKEVMTEFLAKIEERAHSQ